MSIKVVANNGAVQGNKCFTFPAGEVSVILPNPWSGFVSHVLVKAIIRNAQDMMELMLIKDIIDRDYGKSVTCKLHMYYVPYGRQDRVCNKGESFSLKVFCNVINNLKFQEVYIADPHSEVTPALLDNCKVIPVEDCIKKYQPLVDIIQQQNTVLVSPDAGANKKVLNVAKELNANRVIRADKVRELSTGQITHTEVFCDDLSGKTCVIVDDICDGGRTFLELAKVLKEEKNASKVILYVTHGIFSKGLEDLDKYIDEYYTTNSYYKGDEEYVNVIEL